MMSNGIGSYLFVQTALLIAHYGFDIDMPRWVLWFPSIITGIILFIVIMIMIIMSIFSD